MSSRRLLALLAVLAASVLLLAACGDDDGTTTGEPGSSDPADDDDGDDAASDGGTRPWIAGTWALQSATGDDGPLILPTDRTLELTITGPDRIEGDAGCNQFGGRIDAPFDGDRDGGSLTLSELFWTEMACADLDFEVVYLDLLTRVDSWELAPPSGLVFGGDGIELVYGVGEAPPELTLGSSTWILDTVFDGEGMERTASSMRADLPEVTMAVTGSTLTLLADGCAPIEAEVETEDGVEGSFLVADPADLATLVDCEESETNLTTAVEGLAISTGYQSVDGRLTLIGLPGETLSFRAADG